VDDNTVIVEEPTPEEIETTRKKIMDLMNWAQSLTAEQIAFLCDGGWYNNAMKGYAVIAAQNAGFTAEQIQKLLDGFHWAFEFKDKEQAEQVYRNF
jgi:ribulose bisphosphate carboxylase small subunit